MRGILSGWLALAILVIFCIFAGMYALDRFGWLDISGTFKRITSGNQGVLQCAKPLGSPDFIEVRTTGYFTPYETDFGDSWWGGHKTDDLSNDPLYYCRFTWDGFFEAVQCQGSGITKEGLVCQYSTIDTDKEDSVCLDPSKGEIGSRGETATGTNPTPHRTVAVGSSSNQLTPKNSLIYIVFLKKDPVTRQLVEDTANPWNGCYKVEDTGGGVEKNQLDIYLGAGREAYEMAENEKGDYANVWMVESG
jgi:3D (Asp-Asp-Asp) domain-containing protein